MRARRLVTAASGLLPVAALLVVTASSAAPAATPDVYATTVSTTTCTTGVMWHLAYRLFANRPDVTGVDATSQLQHNTAAAQAFADEVGTDSSCAARATVDIYQDSEGFSADHQGTPVGDADFRATHLIAGASPYDVVMYAYPEDPSSDLDNGECGAEYDSVHSGVIVIVFPVGANHTGCTPTPATPDGPGSLLILHELLHGVVDWSDGRVDWPTNDVHGACAIAGYTCSGVNETYFHDLMTHNVKDNDGVVRGITAEQWGTLGTPASIVILSLSAVGRTGVAGTATDEVARPLPNLPLTLRTYSRTPGIPEPADPVVASATTDAQGKVFFPLATTDPQGNRYIAYYLAFTGSGVHPRSEASASVSWFVDPQSTTHPTFPFPTTTPSSTVTPRPPAAPGALPLRCAVHSSLVVPRGPHQSSARSLRSTVTCTRKTGSVLVVVQRRFGARWRTVVSATHRLGAVIHLAQAVSGPLLTQWRVRARAAGATVGAGNIVTLR